MLGLSRGNLYHQIQNRPLSVSEKDMSSLLTRARLDPRLMEVLAELIRDFWWILDPQILNRCCKKEKDSFVLKVLVACILDHCEIDESDRRKFSGWVREAVSGLKDPNPQLLYLGVHPLFSKAVEREVKESLDCFKRHGLFAKDLPFNKGRAGRLKSQSRPAEFKLSETDFLRFKYINKIKSLKKEQRLTNEQIIQRTGINRVFLSKILNHKAEGISLEYLEEHVRHI